MFDLHSGSDYPAPLSSVAVESEYAGALCTAYVLLSPDDLPTSVCFAGVDGFATSSTAQMPLAAGSRPRPRRLYWVPAVGVLPAIEPYRQESGLASVPLPPTVDVAAVVLSGSGEEQPPGQPRGEDLAAAAVDGMQGLGLSGGQAANGRR